MAKKKPIQFYLALYAIMAFLLFGSCNNQNKDGAPEIKVPATTPQPPANDLIFDKLVGTWQNEDGKSYERWIKNDGGTYRSFVFSVNGSDTLWNEQANIYQQNGKWVFENAVRGQNDGKAVKFLASLLNENSVQFSNPVHDFPTDVNYTVTGNNSLSAFIIGPAKRKGVKDTIPFNYTRVK